MFTVNTLKPLMVQADGIVDGIQSATADGDTLLKFVAVLVIAIAVFVAMAKSGFAMRAVIISAVSGAAATCFVVYGGLQLIGQAFAATLSGWLG